MQITFKTFRGFFQHSVSKAKVLASAPGDSVLEDSLSLSLIPALPLSGESEMQNSRWQLKCSLQLRGAVKFVREVVGERKAERRATARAANLFTFKLSYDLIWQVFNCLCAPSSFCSITFNFIASALLG